MRSRRLRLRSVWFVLAVLLAVPSSTGFAQPAEGREPPPLAMMVKRTDRSEPIRLTKLDVKARVVGHLAQTTMTMTFHNPHDRALEGDLYFPLPAGATVSGYALDVNGQMVDGVVVTKEQARRAFEAEVRRGVDPGLVEWVGANTFKTRVFPLPARGERTVRVEYVAEIVESEGTPRYQLPLRLKDEVGELSVRVEVIKPEKAPKVLSSGVKGLKFGRWSEGFLAEATAKKVKPQRDLVIALPPVTQSRVRVERSDDGNHYFSLRFAPPAIRARPPAIPTSVRVLWDASRSRETGADLEREVALLRSYLSRLTGAHVEVVPFRDALGEPRSYQLPAQLEELMTDLAALPYDGGTQFGALAELPADRKPQLQLLFSDGVSTFGDADPGTFDAPTWALNSAASANHTLLRHLAESSGGGYLNLANLSDAETLGRIGAVSNILLSAKVKSGQIEELVPAAPHRMPGATTIAGRLLTPRATLVLTWGTSGKNVRQIEIALERDDAVAGELLRRDWAQKKVDTLMPFPKKNANLLRELGRTHAIVTPGTSLIVLESLEQYVRHGIRPPASLKDMRAEWDARMEKQRVAKKAKEKSRLEHVLGLWKTRVAWWETTFEYPEGFRYGAKSEKKEMADEAAAEPAMAEEAPAPAMTGRGAGMARPRMAPKMKKKAGKKDRPRPQPAIVIAEWSPDTPYLKALKAAAPADRYGVYLTERKQHGNAPSFFLDCADFFRRNDEPALALRVLSNIAELKLEDPALLRVLAHRLAQLDLLDLSAGVFDEVLQLRTEEPQSYRDLALVLARRADGRTKSAKKEARADYLRAMKLLARVVIGEWDRFSEIEVIALMELNNVLVRAKRIGVKDAPIDPRLVKALDVDVRIVMTWDADMTDMDLHVIEPSAEEAYYSHNRTTIGGMVTRDFTRGYGPEVYLLKKAMHGTYKIRTKYYGTSAAKLSGAVTLQVDVFTDYGRPTQQRKSLTFRLTETKEMFTVGEIEF